MINHQMKEFILMGIDLRSRKRSRINLSGERFDRRMLRNVEGLLEKFYFTREKKKMEEQFRHCVFLVGIFPTRFDNFIEQTGRTTFIYLRRE